MYSLLHAPSTKANNTLISVLAVCSESVSEEQKNLLRSEGVTVVEVKDVPVNWWIYSGVSRWKEQFTKLRVFQMIEYKRILFIDADTLITRPLDAIFSEPEVTSLAPRIRDSKLKSDELSPPKEWFFAARSDSGLAGERDHPIPPFQTTAFSAGFFMLSPHPQLYAYLLSVMSHWRRFDPFTMEQSLLNYVFRREGTMPWRELNWKWSATWPTEGDVQAGVATVHEKLWNRGPELLQRMWREREQEMMNFYGSYR
ncbi:nucleotide-diphospho-sugar transferase [Massarina eburnea CBS 473.64]|uniref:Nucleotide-diphospho-sugar transferase n=1 Tax=Massarina eburnea CBS 473.64 TaxID=1395130 RepID=A0A6A6S809_9PLEO|nr:nucleotide-diphospho-sugar transferase [Massarina eburnea CBS 473.64]